MFRVKVRNGNRQTIHRHIRALYNRVVDGNLTLLSLVTRHVEEDRLRLVILMNRVPIYLCNGIYLNRFRYIVTTINRRRLGNNVKDNVTLRLLRLKCSFRRPITNTSNTLRQNVTTTTNRRATTDRGCDNGYNVFRRETTKGFPDRVHSSFEARRCEFYRGTLPVR